MKKLTLLITMMVGISMLYWCNTKKTESTETNTWSLCSTNTWETCSTQTGNTEEVYCGEGILYGYYDLINNKKYEEAYAIKQTTETFDKFKQANASIKKVDIISEIEDKWNGVKQFRIALSSNNGTIGEYSIKKAILGCKIEDISSRKLPSMSFVTTIDEVCAFSWNKERYRFDEAHSSILVYQYPHLESLIKTGDNIYYSYQKSYGECDPKNTAHIEHYDCITKEKTLIREEPASCYGVNKIIYPKDINNIYILHAIGDWCGMAENYIVWPDKKEQIDFSTFTNASKIAKKYPQKTADAYPSCGFTNIEHNPENMTISCKYNDSEYNINLASDEMCGKYETFNVNILTKTIQ